MREASAAFFHCLSEAIGLSPNNVTCSILLKGVQKGMQEHMAQAEHVIGRFVNIHRWSKLRKDGYLQKVMKIIDSREVKEMDEAVDIASLNRVWVQPVAECAMASAGLAGIPVRSLHPLRSSTSGLRPDSALFTRLALDTKIRVHEGAGVWYSYSMARLAMPCASQQLLKGPVPAELRQAPP